MNNTSKILSDSSQRIFSKEKKEMLWRDNPRLCPQNIRNNQNQQIYTSNPSNQSTLHNESLLVLEGYDFETIEITLPSVSVRCRRNFRQMCRLTKKRSVAHALLHHLDTLRHRISLGIFGTWIFCCLQRLICLFSLRQTIRCGPRKSRETFVISFPNHSKRLVTDHHWSTRIPIVVVSDRSRKIRRVIRWEV